MTEPRAAIVIPVKNGGQMMSRCLDAVFAQRYEPGFEVVVIDSGSTDGTLDVLARYPVRLFTIPPEEFSHGGTRNYGASVARGEFIVFITADAIPVGECWLSNLLAPFDLDPDIAGCFGRHVAHDGADPVDAWNMDRHFANFGPDLRLFRLDAEHEDEHGRLEWMYDFFSDNNSALRRRVWEQHPLPVVDMAEDQHWAKMVMRLGFVKAYVPGAVVAHSHSYTPWRWVRNWYDQHASYRDLDSPVALRGLRDCARWFVRSSREDVAYLRRGAPGAPLGLGQQARAVANNASRALGAYLGANYPRVPRAVRRRLSNQRRGEASGR
jgi:glycosyltransferase involved in cell wall biosynthesis